MASTSTMARVAENAPGAMLAGCGAGGWPNMVATANESPNAIK
jgi:hypothetical protein